MHVASFFGNMLGCPGVAVGTCGPHQRCCAGGLLCGVAEDQCAALVEALQQEGYHTAVIGGAAGMATQNGPRVELLE